MTKRRFRLALVTMCLTLLSVWGWHLTSVLTEPNGKGDATQHKTAAKTQSVIPFEGDRGRRTTRASNWESEEAAELVLEQLNVMASEYEANNSRALEAMTGPDFVAMYPNVNTLPIVHDDHGWKVWRTQQPISDIRTTKRLDEFLREVVPDGTNSTERQAKFKVIQVELGDSSITTNVRYEFRDVGNERAIQQTALLHCRWTVSKPATAPKLASLEMTFLERTTLSRATLFTDCTKSVLDANGSYGEQVLPGIPHWLSRIPKAFLGQFGHHGMAVGDINNDGLDDIYVCDAGGLPNRLYIQQPDGTARDVSADSNVDMLDDSVGALFVDIDNDGDQDLVVGTDPFIRIATNDGNGKFTIAVSLTVDTDSFSLSAADYDADGDLDIYVCGYDVRKDSPTDRGLPFPIPYNDANNGGKNALLRNDGNYQFTNVTDEVGLGQNNSRFSMAAAWDDLDNDGDLDLYVANDFGRNNLYRNDQGRFVDIAASANVEDHASGMSVSCADYNRDGLTDIYVGNMFSSAGNRVTYQQRFGEGVADKTIAELQRMARGNSLFMNRGDGSFEDVSLSQGVEMGRWAWSSVFGDITNSGWPDLIVSNGYVTNEDSDDL